MARRRPLSLSAPNLLIGGLALAAPIQVVVAADYLSVEAAQKVIFPQADQFVVVALSLTPEQRARVEQLAGPQPPHRSLNAWKAMSAGRLLGYVFVDEVLGKEQFITYAVGIDASGNLGTLEVLAYRESHGQEIRDTAWRRQFDGRRGVDELNFSTDIKNIAGATLSCEHVTEGVRWIEALWQVTLGPSPQSKG
jgi:hypothetical protein